jgi:hypothetical protein
VKHEPVPTTYACQRCGRRDGLDSSLTDEDWTQISKSAGGKNLLCLWCIDEIADANGMQLFAVLHFAGKAVVGGSWPTIYDDDSVADLVTEIAEIQTRAVRREALLALLVETIDRCRVLVDGLQRANRGLGYVGLNDLRDDIAAALAAARGRITNIAKEAP